jgi:ribosome biogenesis GTPase A
MAFENRVYLAGACNVGKSTLASILLGEEIPQRWKSTNGLIIEIKNTTSTARSASYLDYNTKLTTTNCYQRKFTTKDMISIGTTTY